jgi:hypothetical protein|tara:strand:- start:244 stop:465 length:222 start_codon:yes stop_codon:yes gene_type:complete
MKPPRNDYTVRRNTQSHRQAQGLWDVVMARSVLITIAKSEEAAQDIADRLNIDPSALDRGDTRADRAKRAARG